jgi:hypothetical protein
VSKGVFELEKEQKTAVPCPSYADAVKQWCLCEHGKLCSFIKSAFLAVNSPVTFRDHKDRSILDFRLGGNESSARVLILPQKS